MTASERSRRHQAKLASIDTQMNDAMGKIDWARRKTGSSSFLSFINTYCVGIMLDEPPSGKMIDVINQMEKLVSVVTPTQIEMPRG